MVTMTDDNLTHWLTLVHSKGLGPSLLRKLMEGLGSVDAILGSSDSKLRQAGLPEKVITAMRSVDDADIQTDLDWLNDADDRSIITRESKHYPQQLREIADPPLVLYARGDICHRFDQRSALFQQRMTSATLWIIYIARDGKNFTGL